MSIKAKLVVGIISFKFNLMFIILKASSHKLYHTVTISILKGFSQLILQIKQI